MCPPDFYEVNYVINPWMEGNVGKAERMAAGAQWKNLHARLAEVAEVELLQPQRGLPDLVFTANAAVVVGNRAVMGRFLHRERRSEELPFRQWFKSRGLTCWICPPTCHSREPAMPCWIGKAAGFGRATVSAASWTRIPCSPSGWGSRSCRSGS